MMIDLDHFKRINDSFGHRVDDELLEDSERVRQVAAKTVIPHQQQQIQCTISIGALNH